MLDKAKIQEIENIIGYVFKDKSFLIRAFTHPSLKAKVEENYQVLEFLGDSILDFIVAEDLYFPETVKTLTLCGCEFIVCPFGQMRDSLQSVLLRAFAYCYGVPIFFCGVGYGMIADGSGSVAFASPLSPVYTDFENAREYHLIETRRRGFFRTGM